MLGRIPWGRPSVAFDAAETPYSDPAYTCEELLRPYLALPGIRPDYQSDHEYGHSQDDATHALCARCRDWPCLSHIIQGEEAKPIEPKAAHRTSGLAVGFQVDALHWLYNEDSHGPHTPLGARRGSTVVHDSDTPTFECCLNQLGRRLVSARSQGNLRKEVPFAWAHVQL